jgi:hypothetical protein
MKHVPYIEAIFISRKGGEAMPRVSEINAIAGRGLEGDRYAGGTGYYSPHDVCELTLIEGEVLDGIKTEYGLHVQGDSRKKG